LLLLSDRRVSVSSTSWIYLFLYEIIFRKINY
jgi:hypothetical protein